MHQPPGAAGATLEHRQRAALMLFAWRSLQQQCGGQTDGAAQEGFTVAHERGGGAYSCSGLQGQGAEAQKMWQE